MRNAAILAICLAASSPVLSAEQFDLRCQGSRSVHPGRGAPVETKPFMTNYRLDLHVMKFCEDECRVLRDITEVQPQFIALVDSNGDRNPNLSSETTTIDRVSGSYVSFYSAPKPDPYFVRADGTCNAAPFSGFPHPLTKF